MLDKAGNPMRWLFAPAADTAPRGHAGAATFLRVLVGLMWLYNVAWKKPPDFGRESGTGLYKFTGFAVSDPVLPPYSWIVEQFVLPNIVVFGWAALAAETALAVLLLTGAWVRFAAVLGIAQSTAIALSVAFGPHEWPWAYWLMIGAHVLLLFSASGRYFAVDAVRAGAGSPRRLGLVWSVVAVLVGAYSVVGSLGDAGAARGPGLASSDLSLSLGVYNLYGGVALALTGVLVLVSVYTGVFLLGWAAAAVATAAAVSLYAQIGFTDPWLGGNATSAAFLLSVAVIAVATAKNRAAPRP